MKSIKYWLLLAAVAFGCLFYHQIAGLNFLFFSLILQALLVVPDHSLLKEKWWWIGSSIAVLTALAVVVINSNLSIAAFCVSHLYLQSFAFRRRESVFLSFVFSLYSFFAALPLAIIRQNEKTSEPRQQAEKNNGPIYLAIGISLALCFAFFLLYRSASPLFKNFTQQIDLSRISFGWLFACLLGYAIFKGLTTNEKAEDLSNKDALALQPLRKTEATNEGDRKMYRTAGLVLFIILNLFQLMVNALDVNNLYVAAALPEGITLSDFVHQAVFGILATIGIAVICISYVFNSWFSYDLRGGLVLKFGLIWLLQAQVMLLNTVVRNWWYIQSYQLTYLRILVFVVLLVCSLTLYFVWQKLQHKQSNWYFFNSLFKSLLIVFISSSFVDWDRLITSYNINHCKGYENLDVQYLVKLSSANTDNLLPLVHHQKISREKKQAIRQKLYATHLHDRYRQWPSWNFRAQRNENLYFEEYK